MKQWQFLVLLTGKELHAELAQPGMANNGPAIEKMILTSREGGGRVTQKADLLTVSRKQLPMYL